MVVGLCPEDTSTALHITAAMVSIPIGALGTVLMPVNAARRTEQHAPSDSEISLRR